MPEVVLVSRNCVSPDSMSVTDLNRRDVLPRRIAVSHGIRSKTFGCAVVSLGRREPLPPSVGPCWNVLLIQNRKSLHREATLEINARLCIHWHGKSAGAKGIIDGPSSGKIFIYEDRAGWWGVPQRVVWYDTLVHTSKMGNRSKFEPHSKPWKSGML